MEMSWFWVACVHLARTVQVSRIYNNISRVYSYFFPQFLWPRNKVWVLCICGRLLVDNDHTSYDLGHTTYHREIASHCDTTSCVSGVLFDRCAHLAHCFLLAGLQKLWQFNGWGGGNVWLHHNVLVLLWSHLLFHSLETRHPPYHQKNNDNNNNYNIHDQRNARHRGWWHPTSRRSWLLNLSRYESNNSKRNARLQL